MKKEWSYWLEKEKKRENAFLIGSIMVVVLQWLDLITTLQAVSYAGISGEFNPIMRFLMEQSQETFLIFKGLIMPALLFGSAKFLSNYARNHPEDGDFALNIVRFCNLMGISIVTFNALQNLIFSWNLV